jgi:hypothetical protein
MSILFLTNDVLLYFKENIYIGEDLPQNKASSRNLFESQDEAKY